MTKTVARSPPYTAMFLWTHPIPLRVSTHRSARDSVTVEPRFRTAVNVSLTEPRRIESPFDESRRPSRRVDPTRTCRSCC